MSVLKRVLGTRNKYNYKGFKVKHAVQVFVLLALCTWLLNQARRSYENKKLSADADGVETRILLASDDRGVIKLGRKDLDETNDQVETTNADAGEEVEADEEEENKNGETDQVEKLAEEEVEDLIDEDDRD